jgi:hypothetical protein
VISLAAASSAVANCENGCAPPIDLSTLT